MIKKIILSIVILAAIGIGIFLYATRPTSQPSRDVGEVVEGLPLSNDTGRTEAVYRISREKSRVEFRINEILNDKPATAIGVTRDVAGDIAVSGDGITFGSIAVSARTWKTDNERRDAAIARFILKSEDPVNEFMRFEPKNLTGVPAAITPGSELHLTLSGDLTISGVTKPATFDIIMRVGDAALSGTATLNLKRSDFGLTIPQVQFVASVDDEFVVIAEIVADRIEQQ